MTRRGLGRGLDALITGTDPAAPDAGGTEIDIDKLSPNPHQPRQQMDDKELAELAASIRSHGVIQPVVITSGPGSDEYTIVAGERRWRAARLAGLRSIPVVLREVSESEMLTLAIVENIQRSNLNPIEAARGYSQLMEQSGLTQSDVADLIGKSRVAVANTVRLLSLPEDVQALVANGDLSEGHGRALLGLADREAQRRSARAAIDGAWTVRRLESEVRSQAAVSGRGRAGARATRESSARGEHEPIEPDTAAAREALEEALGTKVEIRRRGEAGQIVVHFFSEEELSALYDRLVGAH